MLGIHFSFEEDQSVTFPRTRLNPSQAIDFETISVEQEVYFLQTEVKPSQTFIGENDESTEIDSILSTMGGEENLITSLNLLKIWNAPSECEEILGILKANRNSEPLKEFSRSAPEFYKYSEKRISLQGRVIQNDFNKLIENESASQPKNPIFPASERLDCGARVAVCKPRPRCVPERVSNPFMKNLGLENYSLSKGSN